MATDPPNPPPATPVALEKVRPTTLADPKTAPSATSVSDDGQLDGNTRRNIAYALVLLLASLVLFHFYQSSHLVAVCATMPPVSTSCDLEKEAFGLAAKESQNIFTAIVGLVGSVVGFYFGQKSQQPAG
jgi:hypothetical protein